MEESQPVISRSDRIWKYWAPVAVMLVIQFSFSTDTFSSDETSRFIVPLLKFVNPNLSGEALAFWHHVLRKCAHVTEYFILGMLVYRAFQIEVRKLLMVRFYSVVFVTCAALIDEFHQSIVPSRGPSIIDVGYDCAGGLIAVLLIWSWRSVRVNAE